jgi:hypothetical protein
MSAEVRQPSVLSLVACSLGRRDETWPHAGDVLQTKSILCAASDGAQKRHLATIDGHAFQLSLSQHTRLPRIPCRIGWNTRTEV